jgi:hypothetical protein
LIKAHSALFTRPASVCHFVDTETPFALDKPCA